MSTAPSLPAASEGVAYVWSPFGRRAQALTMLAADGCQLTRAQAGRRATASVAPRPHSTRPEPSRSRLMSSGRPTSCPHVGRQERHDDVGQGVEEHRDEPEHDELCRHPPRAGSTNCGMMYGAQGYGLAAARLATTGTVSLGLIVTF